MEACLICDANDNGRLHTPYIGHSTFLQRCGVLRRHDRLVSQAYPNGSLLDLRCERQWPTSHTLHPVFYIFTKTF